MTVSFSAANALPDRVTRETGGSVDLYVALLAAGLNKDSISGWVAPGSPDPASINFENPTEIVKRTQGTPNVETNARIGQQGASLKTDLQDLTPLGRELLNKTDIKVVDTIATTNFTTAVISTGVQLADQVTLSGTSVPAKGDWLRFPMSSGASATYDYRYVLGATNNGVNNIAVVLETPLIEEPLAGATVARIVKQQLYEASGSVLEKYSALWRISGDDGSTMRTFSQRGYAMNGNRTVGNGKDSQKYALEYTCLARKLALNGFNQPVHWDSDFFPPNRN